jgi:hypothetical protein
MVIGEGTSSGEVGACVCDHPSQMDYNKVSFGETYGYHSGSKVGRREKGRSCRP